MGMFKSVATLAKMGREMNRNRDAAGDVARMQSFMDSAHLTMAALSTRAASTAAINGTPGTAMVLSARNSGGSFNLDPVVVLELVVMVGSTPVPVTITEIVPQLHQHLARAGTMLTVKVGASPADVFIDWNRS